MGWKTGKGTNRSHRAPPQASLHQGPHGLSPGLSRLWAKPWVPGSHSPIGWTSKKDLGPAPRCPPRQQHPRPLPRGTACMPRRFRTCRGLAPRLKPRAPGSGCPVACPRQVWPGTGFLRNPGLTPAPEAAGTKTRGGIKDRLWAQLLFLRGSATWGLQRQPLMFGALQSKILLNECATCVIGTRVVVGVDTSFTGARDGRPGFMAAGTWHVHSHLHGLL